MGTRRIIGALATGAVLVTMWGCGGSAASSPSTAAAQPSAAASQAAPSAAESSAAGPSSAVASFVLPSFVLPSGAKDLEALLPATLCGETALKASMSGDQFMATADATFKGILGSLGKQASDVSFALAAAAASGCSAGIFRVAGVDQNLLQQTFVAEEQKTGATVSQGSVGGKSVYISTQSGGKEYVYFKGDAVIFAQAKDEASAAGILQQLP